jgi:alanine racemase
MRKLPTWVEIDLDTLSHNLDTIRRRVGAGVGVLLTVKADAYGHGAVQVAQAAQNGGERVEMFGVATVDEAIELREAGVTTAILVLSPVLEGELPAVIESGFAVTSSSVEFAETASRLAVAAGRTLDVHIEIDTGMGRSGVSAENAFDEITRVASLPGLALRGVYTHFPTSDTDSDYTRRQIGEFNAIVARLRECGVAIARVHSANSAAVSEIEESHMDLVRPGLLAYGLHPAGAAVGLGVRPVMSWKSRLVTVRRVPAGRTISYGRDYTTSRESTIGVVPVGYGHGYPFALSNRGEMIVSGVRVPIVGRVTMDMTMIDLTDLAETPVPGDEVILVGTSGDATITFHDVAAWADTICYEIMCGISKRVPRTYFRKGKVETYKSLLGVIPNHVVTV